MKYKFEDGGFSQDFYNALLDFNQNNDEEDMQDEDENPEEEQDEDYIEEDEEDTSYEESLVLSDDEDEDPLNSQNTEGIQMALLGMNSGQSQIPSDLSWIKTKNSKVNISNTSSKLAQYLNKLPLEVKAKMLATSGNDNHEFHVKNSKHKTNQAVDFRYDKDVYKYILADPDFKKMGLKVLDPMHGNAPHLHIEE